MPVYTAPMDGDDTLGRLHAWLQRHGLQDAGLAGVWDGRVTTCSFAVDDYLVRAGEHSDTLYVLDSGLVRLFYTTPDGRERNKAFYQTGDITGPVSAAMTATAAPFFIQCLEPVRAIAFGFEDLRRASLEYRPVAHLYTELLAQAFIRNEQREAMLLTCNAEQRYRWLLQHEPELVERVPQFHLASYLGIDAVSLSRLKRKLRD